MVLSACGLAERNCPDITTMSGPSNTGPGGEEGKDLLVHKHVFGLKVHLYIYILLLIYSVDFKNVFDD